MKFFDGVDAFSRRMIAFPALLLAVTALLRLPTLFNDFYDADELAAIVQTWEYMAGGVPGADFSESKLPLYHAIFKLSYRLWPESGWVIVHVFTIFIVYFTSLFLFHAGREIRGPAAGALAALFYAVFISSFNRHFMATNGEIVYNLPLAGGLYFFVMFLKSSGVKRAFHFAAMGAMACAAAKVKFHGLIFLIFALFFLAVYLPCLRGWMNRKYFAFAGVLTLSGAAVFAFDYAVTERFARSLLDGIWGKLYYSLAKGTDPLVFAAKFIHRQGLLVLWHFAVWVPAGAYIVSWARGKFRGKTAEESAAGVLFLLTYLMVFAGGSRLYHHYFMAAYPALSLLAAFAIDDGTGKGAGLVRRRLAAGIVLPGLFFLAWNTKDVLIKHFRPACFYNEPRAIYWGRAALMGHFNDYLLPEASYLGAVEYVAGTTRPGEKIFVWGDGPYLYYFAQRRMGTRHLWPKTSAIRMRELYGMGDPVSLRRAEEMEKHYINIMEIKKPVLFVDTSENGLTGFTFPVTPLIKRYIDERYKYAATIDGMKMYFRKGYRPLSP